MTGRGNKLLVTLAAPLVVWLAGRVLLPGIDGEVVDVLLGSQVRIAGVGRDQLSVVALGITPLLTAFFLVELVALAVPRLRAARRGGDIDVQGGLRRAGLIVTLGLSLVQGFFLARALESMYGGGYGPPLVVRPGLFFELQTAITLAAGVFFVIFAAWLAGRHGLIDGFSTLLASAALPAASDLVQRARLDDISGGDLLLGLGSVVALVAATRWILRSHGAAGHRAPTSGIAPIAELSGASSLLRSLGLAASVGLAFDALAIALVLAGGALYTLLFQWRVRHDEALRPAIKRTATWLLILLAPQLLFQRLHVPFAVDVLLVTVVTAVALDLVDEWRFRGAAPGSLVALREHHSLLDVDATLALLAAASVPAHPRAVNHRALLRFFGPYVPVTILVPVERLDDARRALEITPPLQRAPAA